MSRKVTAVVNRPTAVVVRLGKGTDASTYGSAAYGTAVYGSQS